MVFDWITAKLGRQAPPGQEEVTALRRRLRRLQGGGSVSPAERALAARLAATREAITTAIGDVASCSQCARNRPLPGGRFEGGACCSGTTANLFAEDELAVLKVAGCRPREFSTAAVEGGGCAFRGSSGCTLTARNRPNVCAAYLCTDLRRELHGKGRLAEVETLVDELGRDFEQFVVRREARELDELTGVALSTELDCFSFDPGGTGI